MRSRRVAVVTLVLFLAAGCSALQDLGARVAAMTPLEKATWMMGVYNSVAAEYVAAVRALPEGSEMPDWLVSVRRLLTVAHPLISAYVEAVDPETNAVDDATLEARAISAVIALLAGAR